MDLENSLFLAIRVLMVLLCLAAAGAALRRLVVLRQPVLWMMLAVLLVGAIEAGLDARANVLLRPADPIALQSWLWLAFDLAVPLLALLALQAMGQRDRALAELQRLATTDPLTGLPNRRGFLAQAQAMLASARRVGQPVALAVLDIDRFKLVNDHHGHAAGDAVLGGVARSMRAALRKDDMPGRWGGEEFVLLLPGVDAPGAAKLVERLRASVSADVAHPAGGGTRLTLSAGIATIGGGTSEEAMAAAQEAADAALYRAKEAGRDRVELAG